MIKKQAWFCLMICLICGTTHSLQGSSYNRVKIFTELADSAIISTRITDSTYHMQMSAVAGRKAFREEFVLFPASIKGNLNLRYATHRNTSFQIFDASGRLMFFRILDQGENFLQLKTSLPEGVYIYTIHGQNAEVLKTAKLVIVK